MMQHNVIIIMIESRYDSNLLSLNWLLHKAHMQHNTSNKAQHTGHTHRLRTLQHYIVKKSKLVRSKVSMIGLQALERKG
jgi:hypothetical protein